MECLIKLIGPKNYVVENSSCVFLACDTIMNLLLKVVYCWHHSQKMCFMILVCKRLTILLLFVNRESKHGCHWMNQLLFIFWKHWHIGQVLSSLYSLHLKIFISIGNTIVWFFCNTVEDKTSPHPPAPSLAWFCYHLF